MDDDLNKLIKETESQISSSEVRLEQVALAKKRRAILPKASSVFIIWLIAIVLAIFEFDTVVSIVFKPGSDKIEQDLSGILRTAAESLRSYEQNNGVLPPILPNPSIRGLVRYEKQNDFSFVLTATVADITLVLESSKAHPYRVAPE
ncbi:MAG: hypothetical protein O3B72_06240 [Proteobacteria bacterium]|nr:hypothetical protein [Pseudomonadota bacterium]